MVFRKDVYGLDIEKNLQISILLDYYSVMLTDKQHDVIDLYYNEDLSLSEIAEHEKITRQGVRDSIKRGEQTLLEMEEKFHLAEKSLKYAAMIEEITNCAANIRSEATSGGSARTVVKLIDRIASLANENKDLF